MSPNESLVVNDDRRAEENGRPSDEELMARVQQKDPDAFTELVNQFERELFNYLRRYLGNAEMAEDVAQNTWILIFRKRMQYTLGRKFRPWMYAIATNAAKDKLRAGQRHQAVSLTAKRKAPSGDTAELMDLLVTDEIGPDAAASRKECAEWIQQELSGLSDQHQAVVQLFYYKGLKYHEVAGALDIPIGTVKSRLHSAIKKLDELWQATHQIDEGRAAA